MKTIIASVILVLISCSHIAAQTLSARFDVAVQVTSVRSGEFESTEVGFGGRVAWNPIGLLGIESEIDFYPRDFPNDGIAFSGSRLEGLFGATAGPRLQRIRPFARVRAGFVRFSGAPEPFACVAIFPPPLRCLMAAGGTRPAFDLGGGVEVSTRGAMFLRVDAGDRMVRYPGPSLTDGFTQRDDAFFSHDFRFAVGGGWRF